jgi:RNA polymerase sigma-70 factor (ECF subfamily)
MGVIAAAKLPISDEEVVARVLAGETALFEIIIRRHNQRLYRAARAITRDDAQAEDVMQAAYVHAYEHLAQFGGRASFGAWLIRITVNEALSRVRNGRRYDEPKGKDDSMDRFASPTPSPEEAAASSEIRRVLEDLIEALPDANREVFVLRDVEGMSTAETSDALGISEENVKVRLHRSRAALRRGLSTHAIRDSRNTFVFHDVRCDRMVKNVLEDIRERALRRISTGSR